MIDKLNITKKMKNFKFYFIGAFILLCIAAQAQKKHDSAPADSTKTEKKQLDKRPARAPFAAGTLMNQQTTQNLKKQQFEFMMQHRFGNFENGYQDLLGIYGNANIRLGFDYGIIDRVQVGFGVTKNNLVTDFRGKLNILQQTRSEYFPLSISYFFDMGIAGIKDTVQFPKPVDRLSYFHSIIVSRKFTDWFTLQVAGNYAHYNIVAEAAGTPHDNFSISGGARFKVSPQSSILIEFEYPLTNTGSLEQAYNANKTYPNFGIAWEISTGSHAFQIILATANGILPQVDMVYNANDVAQPKTGLILGFNINRLWSFTGKKGKKE